MILPSFNWTVKLLQTELNMGEIVRRHNDKTTKIGQNFRNKLLQKRLISKSVNFKISLPNFFPEFFFEMNK